METSYIDSVSELSSLLCQAVDQPTAYWKVVSSEAAAILGNQPTTGILPREEAAARILSATYTADQLAAYLRQQGDESKRRFDSKIPEELPYQATCSTCDKHFPSIFEDTYRCCDCELDRMTKERQIRHTWKYSQGSVDWHLLVEGRVRAQRQLSLSWFSSEVTDDSDRQLLRVVRTADGSLARLALSTVISATGLRFDFEINPMSLATRIIQYRTSLLTEEPATRPLLQPELEPVVLEAIVRAMPSCLEERFHAGEAAS